jgi:4-alpha-glucanotransferase
MKTRDAGVLLHISSLPGMWSIGDMGEEAYQFIDFLSDSGLKYWQILPTGIVGPGNSPYQSISAFAGNPLFINIPKLKEMGFLSEEDVEISAKNSSKTNKADFKKAEELKIVPLKKAFENFKNMDESKKWDCYRFCDGQSYWIDDFALFKALKEHFDDKPWYEWSENLKNYIYDEVEDWKTKLGEEIYFNKFVQYLYFKQVKELKSYANSKSVKLIGDIPIFVSYDSSDVWSKSYLFDLNDEKERNCVAGVPPDYFSETGQLWGNPLYRWDTMKNDDYLWWRLRFEALMLQTDLIRLDHFRGFEAYWEVPASEKTAMNGKWVKGPGIVFFETLNRYFDDLPIIAEDLGVITEEVEYLRDNFKFPGMKILQFAFGDSPKNPFLPHSHVYDSIVYTGTHDNSTTLGWYEDSKKNNKDIIRDLKLYTIFDEKSPVWSIIETALSSVSKTAIIPMQDFLELDDKSRMNIPGTAEGNWSWRLDKIPTSKLSIKIQKSLVKFNRI